MLSATTYVTYSLISIQNLRLCNAIVTNDPLNMDLILPDCVHVKIAKNDFNEIQDYACCFEHPRTRLHCTRLLLLTAQKYICMSRTITTKRDNYNFLHREIIYEAPRGCSTSPVTKVHKPPGDLVRSS